MLEFTSDASTDYWSVQIFYFFLVQSWYVTFLGIYPFPLCYLMYWHVIVDSFYLPMYFFNISYVSSPIWFWIFCLFFFVSLAKWFSVLFFFKKKNQAALNFVKPFFVFLVSTSFVSALPLIIVFYLLTLGLICPFFYLFFVKLGSLRSNFLICINCYKLPSQLILQYP